MIRSTLIAASAALGLNAAPAFAQTDRPWQMGPALDRHERAAAAFDRALDGAARTAFERGYSAGRESERARMFGRAGQGWNDAAQSEAYERLEHAAGELRRALVLMQRDAAVPPGHGALVQAREALTRAQNAMTWLPQAYERDGSDGGQGGPARSAAASARAN